ncbi:hypothetical protein QCA50_010840 [Cerrena zonata]|uniref:Uncharacterized protein n=1 Tax=Cerrena zonata TaxID=2478898 RepID=A0AAW0G3X7_9APHY
MGLDIYVKIRTGYVLSPEGTLALARHWGIESATPGYIRDDLAYKRFMQIAYSLPRDTAEQRELRKILFTYGVTDVVWPQRPTPRELRKRDPKYRRTSVREDYYEALNDKCVMFVASSTLSRLQITISAPDTMQGKTGEAVPNDQEKNILLPFLLEKILHPLDNKDQALQFLTIVDDTVYDEFYAREPDPEDPGDLSDSSCSSSLDDDESQEALSEAENM